ncbi:MAG TPA: hypothetical protein VNI20_03340 [Fimbriimonadaceae bacterium]|nr:hypothetical protein [Fimbriimonadaceae bacterium]
MEDFCRSQREALEQLETLAPGAPLLALGQTVFWDEPMKAGVVQSLRRLGMDRRFVSGIHDTDYFAKHGHRDFKSGYAALPHNDTRTQGLWSAAGEFSVLFGSETVISKERLAEAGGKVGKVAHLRPGYLDEVTEAWGWRGVVSFDRRSQTIAETGLSKLFNTLYSTFEWAVGQSLEMVVGEPRAESIKKADQLFALVCDAADKGDGKSLADYYKALAPMMYEAVAGERLDIDTTKTTELLRFNTSTCEQARFGLLKPFLDPGTRERACQAYNEAVSQAEMYPLSRFGSGSLPFDVVLPGHGRGTLRLGKRGGLVMFEDPVGFSYKKPVETVERLAEVLEKKFGSEVVLVGKAVTLIGMLASEFVFVMHEGASGYMHVTRDFDERLAKICGGLRLNPILRVRYEPWDAIHKCKAWIKLPEPLRGPFGADEVSAESLAKRWRTVAESQKALLGELKSLTRPLELIEFLQNHLGGQWGSLATEYTSLHESMSDLNKRVEKTRQARAKTIRRLRSLRDKRKDAEAALGEHWRKKLLGKEPGADDLKRREDLQKRLDDVISEIGETEKLWREQDQEQRSLVGSPEIAASHERRASIAFEAELTRLRLVRNAIIATDGLAKAGHRPSAWWFPLLSPSGCWYKETMKAAEYYLEPLV